MSIINNNSWRYCWVWPRGWLMIWFNLLILYSFSTIGITLFLRINRLSNIILVWITDSVWLTALFLWILFWTICLGLGNILFFYLILFWSVFIWRICFFWIITCWRNLNLVRNIYSILSKIWLWSILFFRSIYFSRWKVLFLRI